MTYIKYRLIEAAIGIGFTVVSLAVYFIYIKIKSRHDRPGKI